MSIWESEAEGSASADDIAKSGFLTAEAGSETQDTAQSGRPGAIIPKDLQEFTIRHDDGTRPFAPYLIGPMMRQ